MNVKQERGLLFVHLKTNVKTHLDHSLAVLLDLELERLPVLTLTNVQTVIGKLNLVKILVPLVLLDLLVYVKSKLVVLISC